MIIKCELVMIKAHYRANIFTYCTIAPFIPRSVLRSDVDNTFVDLCQGLNKQKMLAEKMLEDLAAAHQA